MLKQQPHIIFQKLKPFEKPFIAFGCVIILVSVVKISNYSFSDAVSDAAYQDYFNENYKAFSIRIPKNLNFAEEKVPITNLKVRGSIERELIKGTYWQSQSLLLHQRANRWFPVIEPILKRNNIPDDFKFIALIESQLTNVTSPQGATGFWQLVESTAKGYGLEINEYVDERYNVIKSTEVACKYFKEAYKIFNNWTLVAASYNLGMGGIQAQLNKQNATNYYDLSLTEETAQYIYRLLAMKEIISRPKVYGFMLKKRNMYSAIPTKKITVDSTIHNLAAFASAQGSNYKIVKLFNPWLLANALPNENNKKYIIEIPKGDAKMLGFDEIDISNDTLTKTDSFNLVISPSAIVDTAKHIN